ncbi:MAG: site-specific DNA-methyltransferase [Deltaproteobacteria bacterium]|nr:site-specific DNA-methyltransferase [Deltaproteobacteria bacterium]
MPDTPEKLDLRSHDIAGDKLQELLRLFPEVRTEGGKIDLDKLKLALGQTVDIGRERYGMNWPGKADCFKTIQRPSLGTLRPCPEESVNFDTSENLIIEGDNLEVLKLLQKSYLGKVKMIYIDPPYNTGNDFIYPDNYSESLQTYLEYTGQVDAEGKRFSTNTEADGRFHSKWMNMMYPRLYLARNLLRDDGVIFISIDDSEVKNLRSICDDIFGEESFLATICWQKKYAPANDKTDFSATHDFICVYAKTRQYSNAGKALALLNKTERTSETNSAYKNPDNDSRGLWRADNYKCNKTAEQRPNLFYPIKHPKTGEDIWPDKSAVWRYSKERHLKNVEEGRIWWGLNLDNKVPAYKRFLSDVGGVIADTWWTHEESGHNDEAKKEIKQIFPGAESAFDTPKPVRLLHRILGLATSTEDDETVLDFFAGSGTTGHAVLDLNKEDGGNRKFILVQLPEPTGRKDYPTIADITKERVRRVIKKLNEEETGKLRLGEAGEQDRGFRVFKLTDSNFKAWNANVEPDARKLAEQLALHVSHVRDERSADDILYELLLKSGFPLTSKIERLNLAGKTVYSVLDGAFLICLEPALTHDLIRAIADRKPQRVVCLDKGFEGNDQLKANAVQIFKTKGIESFRTV